MEEEHDEPGVTRHLSQVDNSVEEEFVTPVQVTANGVEVEHSETVETSTTTLVTEIKSTTTFSRQDTYILDQQSTESQQCNGQEIKELEDCTVSQEIKETEKENCTESEKIKEPEKENCTESEEIKEPDTETEETKEPEDCTVTEEIKEPEKCTVNEEETTDTENHSLPGGASYGPWAQP